MRQASRAGAKVTTRKMRFPILKTQFPAKSVEIVAGMVSLPAMILVLVLGRNKRATGEGLVRRILWRSDAVLWFVPFKW